MTCPRTLISTASCRSRAANTSDVAVLFGNGGCPLRLGIGSQRRAPLRKSVGFYTRFAAVTASRKIRHGQNGSPNGTSSGIGWATVKLFAARGWNVAAVAATIHRFGRSHQGNGASTSSSIQ
ncbi:MAG: hypothetical protein DMG96_08735 [Acidobacteria bacterium]|nr:MAG: hypothetical protein DMG96_08735 [Acidobacteriota bacterium]